VRNAGRPAVEHRSGQQIPTVLARWGTWSDAQRPDHVWGVILNSRRRLSAGPEDGLLVSGEHYGAHHETVGLAAAATCRGTPLGGWPFGQELGDLLLQQPDIQEGLGQIVITACGHSPLRTARDGIGRVR